MRVLVACEFSGIVREAFRAKGHDAWSCDLLPTEIPGQHFQGSIFFIIHDNWDLMIAHPPCTYLTCTGNKWFKPEFASRFPKRKEQREEAVTFFMRLAESCIPKICIENPVGIMSTRWRKPDQLIDPTQFGHSANKLTCLWLKGLPHLIAPLADAPLFSVSKPIAERVTYKSGKSMPKWYAEAKGNDRASIRSKTFQGIADAMAQQWGSIDYHVHQHS